jgi:hypothetical protein
MILESSAFRGIMRPVLEYSTVRYGYKSAPYTFFLKHLQVSEIN